MISRVEIFIKKYFFVLLIASLLTACYYDNVQELHPASGLLLNCDTAGTISYNNDIVPILRSNCGTNNSCHSSNNTSGFNLSNYNGLSEQAMVGNLVLAITHDPSLNSAKWMPNNCGGCFINKCSINKIIAWVNRGFPNN